MRTMRHMKFAAAIAFYCLLGGAEAGASENIAKLEQSLEEAQKELDKIPHHQRQKEMHQDEQLQESMDDDYDPSKAPPTVVLMNKIDELLTDLEAARGPTDEL
eukprot:gnl/TRDRNA2_/TRDRNA2_162322_c1_seq1.p1 gnl/TRDRNA2_/TRDRNA2_162322_c1~~gnl/TRDRNA2_/TRDRNA2_162322_c1_seq1.p1  ORF type:complete len:103 (-),score=29.27 gnl/TRDRNA2_/TRDRNA2_162322_c1_seq1:120-428(-)